MQMPTPPVPSRATAALAGAPPLRLVQPAASASGPGPEQLAAWMRAVADTGDRQAFTRLFSHFAPRVKSFLLRGGADDGTAEELAQETMVMLWRKAALFDERQAGVATWVFVIARNLRVDRFRRRGGAAALPLNGDEVDFDTFASDEPAPDEQVHARRLATALREAIGRLPPEQALVLRLSYYDDESHARIAEHLGIPLGTVKSRVRLAVAHLRRLLGEPPISCEP